jgi:RimJ/RimL family protein N-acetyltransferase
MSPIVVAPLTLQGKFIRLEPISLDHLDGLVEAGNDPSIWTYTRNGPIDTRERMLEMIEWLLRRQAQGTDLPFTTLLQKNNRVVGMTRFMDIQPENRSVEIGGTFVTPAYQRTVVNTEAKFLMLRHAFEFWDCIRVQLKTDLRNLASQRAIERLGAVREGVLRDHIILPDATIRSSVYYSILTNEWPQVKTHLNHCLD